MLPPVDVAGRRPFRCDAVFAKHLLDRNSAPPEEGAALAGELGKAQSWTRKQSNETGRVEGSIAWGYASVESAEARVVLADLQGASTLYVNGSPFAGDAYGYGFGGIPVALGKGKNDVYVTGIRGGFSLKLREPGSPLVLAAWDATFPDSPAGEASVLVLNAADRPLDLAKPVRRKLLPLEAAKIPISFDTGKTEVGKHPVSVQAEGSGAAASATFDVEIRPHSAAARHVFTSAIDGSVQPYAVLPACGGQESKSQLGLVLTLHGAGVDALGHVRAYSSKSDLCIVAPTNRRPYGFDWQDWGRQDAYEVLAHAMEEYEADPDQVYLTGHSMGGHGTWHLAANDPNTFAAIAPSAGWISFDTYGSRPKGALADVWHRADGMSKTLDLLSNLDKSPVYILHGEADDNVPASEARTIESALRKENRPRKLTLHTQPGAGHWWDGDASPGVDCVDWPPIFDLFNSARRPSATDNVGWVSVDPSVCARKSWILVEQPFEYGRPFEVEGDRRFQTRSHDNRSFLLKTRNVRRLKIEDDLRWRSAVVSIDSFVQASKSGWYLYEKDRWVPDEIGPIPTEKSPAKCGPFKRAFDRRFVLVYGTSGDEAENKEHLELARWISESWWYRGNGSTEVLTDREFLARSASYAQRNVILFGNADTNAAWNAIVPSSCPLAAKRGALKLGEETFEGSDLAALCVYPRADGPALVGLFADTGPRGARLLGTVPVFVSGVGIPDYALFGSDILTKGDGGVLAAGWFDFAWRL